MIHAISETNAKTPFSMELPGSALTTCLSKCVEALSASSAASTKTYLLVGSSGKAFAIGLCADAYIVISIPDSTSSADGVLSFELDRLLPLIKGRQNLILSLLDSSECQVKQKNTKFSGVIATSPLTYDVIELVNSANESISTKKGLKVDGTLLESIKKGIEACKLNSVYAATVAPLDINLFLTPGKLVISSSDNYHFSKFTKAVDFGKDGQTLTTGTTSAIFAIVANIAKGLDASKIKIDISDTSFVVSCKTFIISLPVQQVAVKDPDSVDKIISGLGKPIAQLELPLSGLSAFVSSAGAIKTGNSLVTLSGTEGKGSLNMLSSTSYGTVKDSLKAVGGSIKESFSVTVEPKIFADVLSSATTNSVITMRIYSKLCLAILDRAKEYETLYVCALSSGGDT